MDDYFNLQLNPDRKIDGKESYNPETKKYILHETYEPIIPEKLFIYENFAVDQGSNYESMPSIFLLPTITYYFDLYFNKDDDEYYMCVHKVYNINEAETKLYQFDKPIKPGNIYKFRLKNIEFKLQIIENTLLINYS